jgi:hypothetical protein
LGIRNVQLVKSMLTFQNPKDLPTKSETLQTSQIKDTTCIFPLLPSWVGSPSLGATQRSCTAHLFLAPPQTPFSPAQSYVGDSAPQCGFSPNLTSDGLGMPRVRLPFRTTSWSRFLVPAGCPSSPKSCWAPIWTPVSFIGGILEYLLSSPTLRIYTLISERFTERSQVIWILFAQYTP